MPIQNSEDWEKKNSKKIQAWKDTFQKQLKYLFALTYRLSSKQFNYKPGPDVWSVAECIEHLNLSIRAYTYHMKPVIVEADLQADGVFTHGTLMGRIMLGALQKPGRHYPAPRSFTPGSQKFKPDAVRVTFEDEVNVLLQTLQQCDGLALGKINMPWPVFRMIKISLAQAFELQILHNDRHFKQAEKIIQREDFPNPTTMREPN